MNLFDYPLTFALILLLIPFLFLPWFLAYMEVKREGDKEGILLVKKKMRRALFFALVLGLFMWIIDPEKKGDFINLSGLGFILIGLILNLIVFVIKGLFCLRSAKESGIIHINRKNWSKKQ